MDGSYNALAFDDFLDCYQQSLSTDLEQPSLFELTLPWLTATKEKMLNKGDELTVHCLYLNKDDQSQLSIAWPLVHNTSDKKTIIRSLGSFYSAITEPIFFTSDAKEHFHLLLTLIDQHVNWHSMMIGPVDENDVVSKVLPSIFTQCKVFNQIDNFYQDNITSFEEYYKKLPSQLRNTVKRRGKKLAATHRYDIKIISTLAEFTDSFAAYKHIYQQSWKGEEFSFDFIEQVCCVAIKENKLRFGLLFVDDEPAAAQLWFLQTNMPEGLSNEVYESALCQQSASIFKLAYEPKFKDFSVGSLLSMALSEYVIEHDNATFIEFGMGSEPYKKDWLANKRRRLSFQVFNDKSLVGKLSVLRHITLPKIKQYIQSIVVNLFNLSQTRNK